MMPSILTCLLGKRLCEDPIRDDHWTLRKLSASLIAFICHTFSNTYEVLIPRIIKTLTKTLLDSEKPLTSHYGAIVGLTSLGSQSIEVSLIPKMEGYINALAPTTDQERNDPHRELEITKCYEALKVITFLYFYRKLQ